MKLQEELGKKRTLMVVKKVDFGVYLGTSEERVLLPKKQVPAGIEIGDPIEVFLYKDSDNRIIATTQMPKIMMGELKELKVISSWPVFRSIWAAHSLSWSIFRSRLGR